MCVMSPFVPPIPARGHKTGYATLPRLPSYPEVVEKLIKESGRDKVNLSIRKDESDCEEKLRRARWIW